MEIKNVFDRRIGFAIKALDRDEVFASYVPTVASVVNTFKDMDPQEVKDCTERFEKALGVVVSLAQALVEAKLDDWMKLVNLRARIALDTERQKTDDDAAFCADVDRVTHRMYEEVSGALEAKSGVVPSRQGQHEALDQQRRRVVSKAGTGTFRVRSLSKFHSKQAVAKKEQPLSSGSGAEIGSIMRHHTDAPFSSPQEANILEHLLTNRKHLLYMGII